MNLGLYGVASQVVRQAASWSGRTSLNSSVPVSGGSVVEPSTYYNYTLDDPASIPEIVTEGAGINKIHPYGVSQQ